MELSRTSVPRGSGLARAIAACGAFLVGMLCATALAAIEGQGSQGEDKAWKQTDSPSTGDEVVPILYPGVDPEKQTGVAPLVSNAKKSALTVVTWPGFQMVDGGSRVFVQLVKGKKQSAVQTPARATKVPFDVPAPSIVYSFTKKVVLIKNNLNPLVTRSFNTPVNEVRMVRRKGIVYMVLSLRAAVEPVREELVETADGYHYFFVEFAQGSYLAASTGEESDGSGKTVVE